VSQAAEPIVIAGAGIGGLAAALCVARAGRRVAVLERAAKIEEVGAGLQIAPNAGRILQSLGLGPDLERAALRPEAINILRARDGATLARIDLGGAEERWGAPFRLFHRADLQGLLLAAAERTEALDIRANARVGDFEEAEGAVYLRVQGASGFEDMEAAGLVGADGVRSSVRSTLIADKADAPAYSGHTAWRALIDPTEAPAELREREVFLWLGRRGHVVHYPLRDASIINAVVVVEDGGRIAPEGPPTLSGAEVAGQLETRPAPPLRELIEAGPSWRRWPLYGRPPLNHWSRGAVTLLGDAAHPMLPFLAQGAAQAIEDAEALGRALATGAAPGDAFRAYEQARLARATRVQHASRRQAFYDHAGAPLDLLRDLAIRALGRERILARNKWIYEHR